eukprot:644360-Lingulodinium_polyedra.AAC.1
MLSRLPADNILSLAVRLKVLEQWGRPLNIGAGCSGTDAIVRSFDILAAAWRRAYDTFISLNHAW